MDKNENAINPEEETLDCCGALVADGCECCPEEPWDGFMSDAEADADALASAGWGSDEDYGFYDDGGGW